MRVARHALGHAHQTRVASSIAELRMPELFDRPAPYFLQHADACTKPAAWACERAYRRKTSARSLTQRCDECSGQGADQALAGTTQPAISMRPRPGFRREREASVVARLSHAPWHSPRSRLLLGCGSRHSATKARSQALCAAREHVQRAVEEAAAVEVVSRSAHALETHGLPVIVNKNVKMVEVSLTKPWAADKFL